MKNKDLHSFKSSDLVVLTGLLFICLGVVGHIVRSALEDQVRIEAYRGAENISKEIIAKVWQENVSNEDGRSPASVLEAEGKQNSAAEESQVGKDPWGSAYEFSIVESQLSRFVVIWSLGPNMNNDTNRQQFSVNDKGHLTGVDFGGDDVGYIRQIQ